VNVDLTPTQIRFLQRLTEGRIEKIRAGGVESLVEHSLELRLAHAGLAALQTGLMRTGPPKIK
jgi:dihydroorotate dehydrogenase